MNPRARLGAGLFLRAEIRRADATYEELAKRLRKHGLDDTEASIVDKPSSVEGPLRRRSFWRRQRRWSGK